MLDRAADDLAVRHRQLDADPHDTARAIAEKHERAALPDAPRPLRRLRLDVSNLPAAFLDLRRRRFERVREQQLLS